MCNICRINRILESPRGNALLIGVGGSGKQSLSRLAASISNLEVLQVQLRKGYAIADLKLDIAQLYMKAGTKNVGCCFLMTDSQVADEKFLLLINNLLASGEIPGLFADEEIEEIISALRNEVKSQGIEDTRDNIWRYFINKVCDIFLSRLGLGLTLKTTRGTLIGFSRFFFIYKIYISLELSR